MRIQIRGNWDRQLQLCDMDVEPGAFKTVWQADPEPEHWDDIYRFSVFSLQLNRLTPDMAKTLPPTDCRRRPDQAALENGDIDLATSEKHRLEHKQRQAQRQREKAGQSYEPKYFKQVEVSRVDSDGTYQDFVPIRDYWADKETQNWPEFSDIY